MKKITLSAIALSAIFTISTLTSCGGGESHEAKTETSTEVATETATEKVEVAEVEVDLPGKETFKTSGCVACHEPNRKVVGPALKDISAAYLDNREGLTAFLKGEGEAIVDPAQAAVMAPQVEITKAMADADRDLIVDYILSVK